MALLTNINGKFSVSDAGAVTFNNAFTFPTADGAANYVLQTNGSGQLAWALNGNGDISGSGTANTVTKFTGAKTIGNGPITFSGNNSTFAGDVTVTGGDLTLGTDSIASNINGVGDVLNINVDSNTGGGSGANIQFKTAGTTQLTINSSSSTFAGNVTITGTSPLLYINNTTSGTGKNWRFSSCLFLRHGRHLSSYNDN